MDEIYILFFFSPNSNKQLKKTNVKDRYSVKGCEKYLFWKGNIINITKIKKILLFGPEIFIKIKKYEIINIIKLKTKFK